MVMIITLIGSHGMQKIKLCNGRHSQIYLLYTHRGIQGIVCLLKNGFQIQQADLKGRWRYGFMDDKIFKNSIRTINLEYKKIFGCIPCIENYSCTQEEYKNALWKAVHEKKELSEYLIAYENEAV